LEVITPDIGLPSPQTKRRKGSVQRSLAKELDVLLMDHSMMDRQDKHQSSATRPPDHLRRELQREEYHVVLLVDTREIADKGNKEGKMRKTIFQELLKSGIACEERSLALGDLLWIARDKRSGTEYVMDVIVERKKVDDLWSSIKDGRYYEQKVCPLWSLWSLFTHAREALILCLHLVICTVSIGKEWLRAGAVYRGRRPAIG